MKMSLNSMQLSSFITLLLLFACVLLPAAAWHDCGCTVVDYKSDDEPEAASVLDRSVASCNEIHQLVCRAGTILDTEINWESRAGSKDPVLYALSGGFAAGKTTVSSLIFQNLHPDLKKGIPEVAQFMAARAGSLAADGLKELDPFVLSVDAAKGARVNEGKPVAALAKRGVAVHELSVFLVEFQLVTLLNNRASIVLDSSLSYRPYVNQLLDTVQLGEGEVAIKGPGWMSSYWGLEGEDKIVKKYEFLREKTPELYFFKVSIQDLEGQLYEKINEYVRAFPLACWDDADSLHIMARQWNLWLYLYSSHSPVNIRHRLHRSRGEKAEEEVDDVQDDPEPQRFWDIAKWSTQAQDFSPNKLNRLIHSISGATDETRDGSIHNLVVYMSKVIAGYFENYQDPPSTAPYKVFLLGVTLDTEEAVRRAEDRQRRVGQSFEKGSLILSHQRASSSFQWLLSYDNVYYAMLFDTSIKKRDAAVLVGYTTKGKDVPVIMQACIRGDNQLAKTKEYAEFVNSLSSTEAAVQKYNVLTGVPFSNRVTTAKDRLTAAQWISRVPDALIMFILKGEKEFDAPAFAKAKASISSDPNDRAEP